MLKTIKKRSMFLLVVILLVSTGSATVLQFVKGNLFQQALAGSASGLEQSIIFLIVLVLVELLFYFLEWKLENKIYSNFLYDTKSKIAGKFVQKSAFDDLEKEKSDVINTLSNKIDRLEFQYFYALFENVYLFFRIVMVTFSLFYINVFIALVLVAFIFVPLLVTKIFKNRLATLESNYQEAKGENLEQYENIFSNLKVIKAMDLRAIMERKLKKKIGTEVEEAKSARNMGNIASIVNSFLSYFSHVFVLIASIFLVFQGKLEAGMVITLLGLVEQLSMPILSFARNLNSINSTKTIRDDILESLSDEEINEQKYADFSELSTENLAVHFDHSALSYENLTFNLNENYLIEGKSGVGKSLFIDLLLKNRSLYEGKVKIDGLDSAPLGKLEPFAFVETGNLLFKESVKFNLFFDQEVSAEALELARKLLPEQVLNAEGIENLSSGERRRVLLLRGLLSQKKVVIFDEPTSNLDKGTADIFWELLTQIKNKHFIIISHQTPEQYRAFFDHRLDFSKIVQKKELEYA